MAAAGRCCNQVGLGATKLVVPRLELPRLRPTVPRVRRPACTEWGGSGRPTDHPWRARAQPARRQPRSAPRRNDRVHRAVRLRQVQPRLRHDLRRGPAPVRGVAVVVRAAVPRPDGQARRRLHRGPVAGGLDRPEVDLAQPALDGRHDHRGLRLPAAAVRPGRRAALPDLRRADQPSRARSRSSTGCSPWRRAPGSWCSPRWSAAARGSTSTSSPSCSPRGMPGPGSTAWCTR